MHSFDLAFEDFFVPDANVVGGEGGLGKGFYFTMAGMVGGRMQTAARACGVMRAALRAAIRYSAGPQGVRPGAGRYPLTQAKLARMARAARRLPAARLRGRPAAGQRRGRMEASLVKLLACRSAEMVTREALQIHGGMGYAEETAVSRYFVDARVLSIFEGAEETLALKVVARSLLEARARAGRSGMRHPVSTPCCGELEHGAGVALEIVGLAVSPSTPDHSQPGSSEDANCVGMVAAAASCVVVGSSPPPRRWHGGSCRPGKSLRCAAGGCRPNETPRPCSCPDS